MTPRDVVFLISYLSARGLPASHEEIRCLMSEGAPPGAALSAQLGRELSIEERALVIDSARRLRVLADEMERSALND